MMAVLTRSRTEKFYGLRPMDPLKDLGGVANLIEEAFADDLDRSGQNALQELRWFSRLKPVLWWMVYANPDHTDFLSGFVWEDNGKIVGNVTVNRVGIDSRRWLISNVAVSKQYRGQGIAKELMHAGLDLVKQYNSSSVSLQVRTDNEPARKLYKTLHFKEISGITYLRSNRVPHIKISPLPKRVVLRPRNFSVRDAREAYNLAYTVTPISVQKEWPLRQRYFRLSSGDRINNWLSWLVGNGRSVFWIVEDGRRFIALVNIRPGGWGHMHQIELIVHLDWRGYLEKALISRALNYLYTWRNRGISFKHPTHHPEAIEIYKEFGLRENQTLTWLKLDM